jgi:biopolymer transport protein ExbD
MSKPITRIDITPLVGVALILVIVFMVTSPLMMTSADLGIDLPKARTVEAKSESNITISISKENFLALNDKEVNLQELEKELVKILKAQPSRLVVIRADRNTTHLAVLELLKVAKRAGARRLAIATLQRNRPRI